MNGKNKVTSMLSVMFLSVVAMGVSPLPALAKEKASRKQPARSPASRERDHDSARLSVGFGIGNRHSDSRHGRRVGGHYETRKERVLVEPGHYERQEQRVLVEPGRYEIRHIPAVYGNRRDGRGNKHKTPAWSGARRGGRGKKNQVVIRPARTKKVWIPARYEKRKVKVWVPDRYEIRRVKVWVPGRRVNRRTRSPGRFWLNLGGLFRF